jgi:hypothetical protein
MRRRRWSYLDEQPSEVGKIAGDLDEQPSDVGKGSVAESPMRKGADILSSSWFSGRRRSRSHRRPLTVVAGAVAREERDEGSARVISVCRSGWYPRPRARVSESPWNEGFRGENGPGAIPPGFNRTGYKFGPGLNPGESDPGCQTGIRARSRPGWDRTNKASSSFSTWVCA